MNFADPKGGLSVREFVKVLTFQELTPEGARSLMEATATLARLAARVRHPNVAATLDVVATTGDVHIDGDCGGERGGDEDLRALWPAGQLPAERELRHAGHAQQRALSGLR